MASPKPWVARGFERGKRSGALAIVKPDQVDLSPDACLFENAANLYLHCAQLHPACVRDLLGGEAGGQQRDGGFFRLREHIVPVESLDWFRHGFLTSG